jgi:hypothetical protein
MSRSLPLSLPLSLSQFIPFGTTPILADLAFVPKVLNLLLADVASPVAYDLILEVQLSLYFAPKPFDLGQGGGFTTHT